MRQLLLHVPEGHGARVVDVLREHDVTTVSVLRGTDRRGDPVDVIVASLPNAELGPALEHLEGLEDIGELEAVVPSGGVYAFEPPAERPPRELVDVTGRSPLEIVLAGRQSVGGWTGFLGYAATAGVVVWIGLFLETPFLLTAAMLLAPFAGPAMNTAIGVVSGDGGLLRRTVLRYLASIAVTAAVALLMTLLVGQTRVTGTAADAVTLSNVAVLLPLAAGVAGALHLVQSEHSSLVSGAAVGMLVAAALAPPVGTLGMSIGLARWDLVVRALFLLVLQLAGITVAASLVLWAAGLRPSGHRYAAGRRGLLRGGITVAALVTAVLVAVQFTTGPGLQRSFTSREAAEVAASVVADDPRAELLDVSGEVPSADVPGPPRVIVTVVAELAPGAGEDAGTVDERLTAELLRRLAERLPEVVPLVDVLVLERPEAGAPGRRHPTARI